MIEATPTPPDSEAETAAELAPEPARPPRRRRRFLWRWTRRLLMAIAALVATGVVLFFRVDIGRITILKEIAERRGSEYLDRPLHIGTIHALMTPGYYEVTDVVIDGRQPGDRPFFTAKRIMVHVPWWTIVQTWFAPKRDIFVELEVREFQMLIETWSGGKHNIPRLVPQRKEPRGESKFRTTMRFAYAKNGHFIYEDHVTPWKVEAPNLSFSLVRGQGTYLGDAHFDKGSVQIQSYRPMVSDMRTRFRLDGSKVTLNHLDLNTDGTRSHVNGTIDFSRWPDSTYNVNSSIDFVKMREIFFPTVSWRMSGTGHFVGVFKLFKDGRDLTGNFTSDDARLNQLPFPKLHGSLTWQPNLFAVNHAEAGFLGGEARFTYSLAPLGQNNGKPATATFTADYASISAAGLDQLIDLRGLELGGQLDGSIDMQWPNGRFAEVSGQGLTSITAPPGMPMATEALPAEPRAPVPEPAEFDPYLRTRLSLGADLHYSFGKDGLIFDDSWAATRATYVAFSGRRSPEKTGDFAFHVTSHDWQESDRVLASIMSALSGRTKAIKVGGRGTFDGTMTGLFSEPLIKGRFTGEAMHVWDVTWGKANGDITIHNNYVDITNSRITNASGGVIVPDGRFSLNIDKRPPTEDEIKARVTVTNWPMIDFKVPFSLVDWPVDGTIGSLELLLGGKYKAMTGTGKLRVDNGVAWKEPFDRATGDLEFEGTGLVIRNLDVIKGTGRVTGAARIGWDNTYAFNASGERIPFESLDNFKFEQMPLTGTLQFKATGAGSFDAPTYDVDASIADLFIADEGIGLATAKMKIANNTVTFEQLNAASRRLQVFGSGSIAMNDAYDSDLQFRFLQTSIDPYLRFVAPKMSPYTRAIVSGSMQIRGPLSFPKDLFVDATVDEAALTLYDYQIANDGPLKFTYEDQKFDAAQFKLKGQDTSLAVTGGVNVAERTIDMTANGDASLAILQLMFPMLSTRGQATLSASFVGPLDQFNASGKAEIKDGRLRHVSIPQSLTSINGPITFDATGVHLDGLKASLGAGPVEFGGMIAMSGFDPTDFNITANGKQMRISYPEGMTSYVNAALVLRGTMQALVLSGDADVYYARYVAPIDANEGWIGLAAGLTAGGVGAPVSLASTTSSGVPLSYDISIHMNTQPIIQGNQASLEASADLRIGGTYDRPSITGDIDIVGGEVSFNGYRYNIRRGLIALDNPNRIDPSFDLEIDTRARSAGQTYDVTLRLAGTMSRFTKEISSEPYLSEIEAIALLLGASADVRQTEQRRTTPEVAQQQMMGQLIAQLAASTVTNRVGTVFTEVLPIDTFQITPVLTNELALQTLNPSARVTIGTRITNKAYLTYSRAVGALQDEIILIEYDQSNRLSWLLSRNEDKTFALDFRFRYIF